MIRGIENMCVKSVHYYNNSVKLVLYDPSKILPDKELEISLIKRNGIPSVVFTIDHTIVWTNGNFPS